MNQSILTSKTGIRAQQQRLDIIGHNISNVNTVGYKTIRADFKDALYQTLRRPVQPQSELNLELGHGTLLSATTRDYKTGSMQDTGNPLDVMITGEGFFTIMSPNGDVYYTRNGALGLSLEEDGEYLIAGTGWYVLDENGERIRLAKTVTEENSTGERVTRGATISDLNIDGSGRMRMGDNEPFAQIGLRTFADLGGLESVGSSMFAETVSSGEPLELKAGSQVRQGYLEMSGVDLANEMTRMIRTQRAMQLSSRALTTADQMMGVAVNIRRG